MLIFKPIYLNWEKFVDDDEHDETLCILNIIRQQLLAVSGCMKIDQQVNIMYILHTQR